MLKFFEEMWDNEFYRGFILGVFFSTVFWAGVIIGNAMLWSSFLK